jgi:hypothetical protein
MEAIATKLREAPPVRVLGIAAPGAAGPHYLMSRQEAARVGAEIAEMVEDSAAGTLVVINLEGVETRASCLALLLGPPLRLVQSAEGDPELRDRYVVLQGPLGSNERDAHLALADEKLVAVVRDPGGPRLIGKVDRMVEETYPILVRHREVTSALLMEPPFGMKIAAANARVTKLHKLGLLRHVREEFLDGGGRRFVYEAVR